MPFRSQIVAATAVALLAIAPRSAAGSSVAAQIGWLEDGCLAVPNGAIEPGAAVTFLLFDPERAEAGVPAALLVPGAILRTAAPSTSCAVPRVEVNRAEPDWTLYEARLDGVRNSSRAQGIGIVGLPPEPTGAFDFDGDGVTDSIGLCQSAEGVEVDVWSDRPGQGERLWRGFRRSRLKADWHGPCERSQLFYAPLAPLDAQVGYVDECLAIKDPTLEFGTPITVIASETRYPEIGQRRLTRRVVGTILGKVDSPESCPPLYASRRKANDSEGFSFYSVALEDGPFMNPRDAIFGIGIVGRHPGAEEIDFDENGAPDSFTTCKSLEGLNLELWSGAPEEGDPLWQAYYYLAHDSAEWDCPGMFDDDLSNSTSEPP